VIRAVLTTSGNCWATIGQPFGNASLGADGYIAMLWKEGETGQRKLMARGTMLGERSDASFPTS